MEDFADLIDIETYLNNIDEREYISELIEKHEAGTI
jgi:hypothetical protein